MPTLTSVNAQWTNSLAVTDADSRRINAGTFVGDGTALGARGGIVRHGDTSLLVTVNGSDQITVQPGVVAIPSSVALAGVYMAAFGAVTGPGAGTAIATRNSTNPRIDLVVADTAAGVARIRTVDGTPSSSPVAPSLPAGSVELSRLSVPALGGGAVTVDSTWRTYAASLGGVLYVETAARLPGSGNQKGQRATALDTNIDYRWSGTAWVAQYADWVEVSYRPSFAGAVAATVVARRNAEATLSLGLNYTAGSWAAGAWAFTVPAGFIPSRTIDFWASSNDWVTPRAMAIQADGAVVFRAAGSGIVVGTITYPVAL